MHCNNPDHLIRIKTVLYPDGRTSFRFKYYLKGKVTIFDKNSGEIIEKPGAQEKVESKKEGQKKTVSEQKLNQEREDPLEPECMPEEGN